MSSIYGNKLKISLFGESHSFCVGMTIDGFPEGVKIPFELIKEDLKRRRSLPEISTSRVEDDEVKFISGVTGDITTGAPLTFIIENKNVNSDGYKKGQIRPSHADYPAYIKYQGFNDYRGGGHFSGRLTAPIVVLGTLCKQLLLKKNIKVLTRIKQIGHIKDENNFDLDSIKDNLFPTISEEKKIQMINLIKETKEKGDSIGGIVECVVLNLPIGIGEPYFDGVDSVLSSLLFSLGGVKGVSFGDVDEMIEKPGSMYNDQISIDNKNIKFLTNHAGGVLGGLTNGENMVISVKIKPTPSIFKEQSSIDIINQENINLKIKGRHDPCIVHRVSVAIESLVAYGLVDLIMTGQKW